MSITDELLENAATYASTFTKGDLPLPPGKHVAFRASIEADTGIRPTWAAESFTDLDGDVRQNIARIHAESSIPVKTSVRGFVYDVRTGGLREVT